MPKEWTARELAKESDFYGGTLERASSLARDGWGGAPKLTGTPLADSLKDHAEGTTQGTIASTSGAYLDIGAFISGDPECFQEFAPIETPRGLVLGINLSAAGMVKKEQLANKGAVMLAISDTLEKAGFTVSLMAIFSGTSYGAKKVKELYKFPLKRAGERVDENQLAYWCCHDSAIRQLFFSFQDTQATEEYVEAFKLESGRGRPRTPKAGEANCDYVFPHTLAPKTTKEAMSDFTNIMGEIEAFLAKGPS